LRRRELELGRAAIIELTAAAIRVQAADLQQGGVEKSTVC
jgi:hypothetical protein